MELKPCPNPECGSEVTLPYETARELYECALEYIAANEWRRGYPSKEPNLTDAEEAVKVASPILDAKYQELQTPEKIHQGKIASCKSMIALCQRHIEEHPEFKDAWEPVLRENQSKLAELEQRNQLPRTESGGKGDVE